MVYEINNIEQLTQEERDVLEKLVESGKAIKFEYSWDCWAESEAAYRVGEYLEGEDAPEDDPDEIEKAASEIMAHAIATSEGDYLKCDDLSDLAEESYQDARNEYFKGKLELLPDITKEEAFEAVREGKKIWHSSFQPTEFLWMEDDTLFDENNKNFGGPLWESTFTNQAWSAEWKAYENIQEIGKETSDVK